LSIAIGVRDSGVGGLTVARCIQQHVPDARLLYFADTAHVPYGERTPEEVRHYALSISRFLIEQGAQILVFACNTSSALALPLARATFDVPIYGTIEPGALAAAEQTQSGKVGVLATRATVESGVYSMYLRAANKALQITEEACPEFVPLVENEQTCSDAAREAVQKHLAPLQQAGCDTVVLGCTHYPLLLPLLREAAPEICFVDPAENLAANVALQIEVRSNSTVPEDQFWASGESEGVERWIEKLLAPAKVQRGPVFDLT
jgi:glutamate racemase